MLDTKDRKWIAKRIAKLDPHKDYAEIVKLSVIYRNNDAFMDLVYAITFPNFIVPNRGAIAVMRDGKGKAVRHGYRRMDETGRHILIWKEFGPEHEYTQRSVASLNKLHTFWSKHYPDGFSFDEDYKYVMCYETTLFHRLLLRIGAKGLSEKEKIASLEFYKNMAPMFINPITGEAIQGPEDTFDACVSFAETYENTKREDNKCSDLIEEYMLKGFGRRHFPPMLQPLAYSLVLSLLPEGTIKGLGVKPASPLTKRFCRFAFRSFLWIGETLAPDPKQSYPELLRAREGWSVEDYVSTVAGGMQTQPQAVHSNGEVLHIPHA
jgi:hypothetical protein